MALLCPKCHNVMNQYERNGVHVDQCVECGGLFLDRGELDHLVKAEAIYYGEPVAAAAPVRPQASAPPRYEERYPARAPEDRRFDEKSYKKKRRSFFEDLLDI